ncbi:MAG: hypothetical protein HYW37_01695 [Candidatus Colwellbacteria bacterium]|nr:hypothetical protein [Candidatus Colwellbacteria bacterium]
MPIGKFGRLRSREQFLILVGLVLGALFLLRVIGGFGDPVVPQEFLDARSRGAAIAEEIVALSKESGKNLELVSKEDEKGNYSKAYDLVLQELAANKKARGRALALSSELEIMAKKLPDIGKNQASAIGLQATVDASQIVQRLIDYNDHTYQLLRALNSRFSGEDSRKIGAIIKSTIKIMNEEAEAINNLNEKYKNLMAEFDRAVR